MAENAMNDDPRILLLVTPEIEDSMPSRLKEAIARRRIVAISGRCVCGARPSHPQRAADGVTEMLVVHDDRCPAPIIDKLYRRWQRQQHRKGRP
jgi:hypothetical protein